MQPPIFTPYEPPPQPPAPMRVRFDGLTDAWDVVKRDFTPFVIVVALFIAVTVGFVLLLIPSSLANAQARSANPFVVPSPFENPGQVISLAIGGFFIAFVMVFLQATCQRIALLRLRGHASTVSDMFNFAGRGGALATWALLFGCINVATSLVGEALQSTASHSQVFSSSYFIVLIGQNGLGILVQVFFVFAPLMIIDQGLSPLAALTGSLQNVGRRFFPILGMYILVNILAALGFIACCVGIFFTMPVALAWPAVLYNDFFRPAPSTGPKENEFYPRPQY